MNRISSLTAVLLTLIASLAVAYAQEGSVKTVTPEQAGFDARTASNEHGEVRFYVSTEGKPFDQSRNLPLVLYLDGSGPSPLYWVENGRVGCSLMFDAREIPGYHYAVISKPGIKFCANEKHVSSKVYDETECLRWRVDAAHSVINELVALKCVDARRILVVGHSEGADVAPWVALENKNATHVAGLAAGGPSLMHDFIVVARKEMASGKLSQTDGEEEIRDIKQAFRDIFSDPKSTSKKWSGEAYLRWSTFFQPGIEAWVQIEKPVYLAICQFDENTPVESGEAIELEFIRLGKKNLISKMWPCDHYFMEPPKDKDAQPTDRRLDVLKEILGWAK